MVEIVRVRRPFWMHQIVEYMVGIALVAAAVQQLKPAVPGVMGLLVILNAAIAKGGAGAFQIVGHKMHRRLDIVVLVILTASTLQPWVEVDITSRLLVGAITFVLFTVWFHTDFEERATKKARKRRESEDLGKQAGRVVGDTVNSLRRWKDSMSDDGDETGDSGP